jgi:hypothetical protein
MISLEEARNRIGDRVDYRRHGGPPQPGVITSVNSIYVFVRYDSAHPSSGGVATPPADLRFLDSVARVRAENFGDALAVHRSRLGRWLRRALDDFARSLGVVIEAVGYLARRFALGFLVGLIVLPLPVAAIAFLVWAIKS